MQFERACLCVCMLIYFVLNFTVFKLKAADVNIKVESKSCSVVSNSCIQPHELYSPWNSSGQNTGVGNLSLLQGIFPTQGLNPGLPHCGWILYQLSHKGSPRTLEWVAYPFPVDLSDPGIHLGSPALQADSYQLSYDGSPGVYLIGCKNL